MNYNDISYIKGAKEKRYIHVSKEYEKNKDNKEEKQSSPKDIPLEINASLDKESIWKI